MYKNEEFELWHCDEISPLMTYTILYKCDKMKILSNERCHYNMNFHFSIFRGKQIERLLHNHAFITPDKIRGISWSMGKKIHNRTCQNMACHNCASLHSLDYTFLQIGLLNKILASQVRYLILEAQRRLQIITYKWRLFSSKPYLRYKNMYLHASATSFSMNHSE